MPRTGTIVSWKSEKGFGFIAPEDGGKEIFVHIKALGSNARQPEPGTKVTYIEASDNQGRLRAERVELVGAGLKFGSPTKALLMAVAFLFAVAWTVVAGLLPVLFLWFYLGSSVLAFAIYGLDKRAAKSGQRRTPESTLHLLSLLGGWPGAMYAQQLFRHKSVKQPFRTVYWITVVINIGWFCYLVSGHGEWLVYRIVAVARLV